MIALSEIVYDVKRDESSSVIPNDFRILYGNRNDLTASATIIGTVYTRLSSPALQIISKLESFKSLAPNWDSYGATPPSSVNVDRAISFVKRADKNALPLYFVASGPNGELVVEFKNGVKEASAFINPDGSSELILNVGNDVHLEGTLEGNYKDLLHFING